MMIAGLVVAVILGAIGLTCALVRAAMTDRRDNRPIDIRRFRQ